MSNLITEEAIGYVYEAIAALEGSKNITDTQAQAILSLHLVASELEKEVKRCES